MYVWCIGGGREILENFQRGKRTRRRKRVFTWRRRVRWLSSDTDCGVPVCSRVSESAFLARAGLDLTWCVRASWSILHGVQEGKWYKQWPKGNNNPTKELDQYKRMSQSFLPLLPCLPPCYPFFFWDWTGTTRTYCLASSFYHVHLIQRVLSKTTSNTRTFGEQQQQPKARQQAYVFAFPFLSFFGCFPILAHFVYLTPHKIWV